MGIHRKNGYSASVEGFFVLNGEPLRLAKTNGKTFVLTKPHAFAPNTIGEMLIIIDGERDSKQIRLPEGSTEDQAFVPYVVDAPF